ncbi:MAG: hypothetical protein JNJ77_01985 [Planctomycetia bacterium]|nr:hypothetical protein [Planctomycetia bacterium]
MKQYALSNLRISSNLLSFETYQQEMYKLPVLDLRNIRSRFPNLFDLHSLPDKQKNEWTEMLQWGDSPPPKHNDNWAEEFAEVLPEWLTGLEERPSEEEAFELLLIAQQLLHSRIEESGKAEAATWYERILRVLCRHEFKLTRELIEQRAMLIASNKVEC